MEKVSSILSHLVHQPQFKFLLKHTCYQKFIQILPTKFKKAIAFVYIDNNTLFVALSHPGYKMELNYNKDLLKSLLNMMGTHNPDCSQLSANKVIVFNSKFHNTTPKVPEPTNPKYRELSSGDFKICSNDTQLIDKFKQIKETIMENRN